MRPALTLRHIDVIDGLEGGVENIDVHAPICAAHPARFAPPETITQKELFLPVAQDRFLETGFDVPALNVYRASGAILSGQYALISGAHVIETDLRPFNNAGPAKRVLGSTTMLTDRAERLYRFDPDERGQSRVAPPAFLLASRGDRMHHHWLFDVLSKLHVWESVFDKQIKLAVPSNLSAYKKQAYHDLGISDADMIVFDVKQNTQFDELYFAPCLSQTDWLFAPALITARERLFAAYDVDYANAPPTRHVFLSRRDMLDDRRVLLNEMELSVMAQNRGLEAVTGSQMSFAEQVRYFASVGTCAIVHGSAGGNVLFGNRHMNAVHLHPSCIANFRAHGRVNAAIGHRYSYLLGPAFFRRERMHSNPWYVDPVAFGAHLDCYAG